MALTLMVVTETRKELLEARVSLAEDHIALGKMLNAMRKDARADADEIAQLRDELRLMRMRVSSLAGVCDPEITRLIFDRWLVSKKVLTLRETYRLAWVESRCDPFATDGQCFGVMQVDPRYALPGVPAEEAKTMLTEPAINIEKGMAHLDDLGTRFPGDKVKILTAYNWGARRTQEGATTGEFARKVLR